MTALALALLLVVAGSPVAGAEAPPPRVEVRGGLGNVRAKLERGQPVTVAFVGGSLTELPGWRDRFVAQLRRQWGEDAIVERNAGLSATGSDVAALRLDHEVLAHDPDLVVVEFAANDVRAEQLHVKRALEGIVRKIWSHDSRTDILFVYFYDPSFASSLREGQPPPVIAVHDRLARRHGIPSIDVTPVVAEMVQSKRMRLRGRRRPEKGKLPAFSRDGVHPHPFGHGLYANAVAAGWQEILSNSQPIDHGPELDRQPVKKHWQQGKLVALTEDMLGDGWRRISAPFADAHAIRLWESTEPGATLEFGFRGDALKIYEQRKGKPGRLELRIDGKSVRSSTFRPMNPGPPIRVLHVRHEFDPKRVHHVSLRAEAAPDGTFTPVRLGDLLVLGDVLPVDEAERPVSAPPDAMNVLLVTLDTTRPDALGVYGSTGGHTPNLDALAADATVFERVVAPMGATFPSHATLFTGRNPREHGVRANHDALSDEFSTLAEDLSSAGYDTGAIVAFGSMVSRGGLHQGFDYTSDDVTGASTGTIRDGAEVTALAVDWLERRRKPFFLWLHYFEPHAPYRRTSYAARELEGYDGPFADGADVDLFYSIGKKIPWSPAERRAIRVLYDGEVREADQLLAPIFEKLEQKGWNDDTLVIVTADHGQSLGESGRVGHGRTLDESVLRVPLIVRNPRAKKSPARVAGRVGLVDLRPTVLDLVELDSDEAVDGRSLAGVWRGEPLDERLYYAEMNEPLWDTDPGELRRPDVAIYEGDVKAVYNGRGTASFDLAKDPKGHTLVDRAAAPRAAELEALAEAYHGGAKEHSGHVKDPDVAAELRALGYLD